MTDFDPLTASDTRGRSARLTRQRRGWTNRGEVAP